MSTEGPWQLRIGGRTARILAEMLPHDVGAAVIEFIQGPLRSDPHGVGKALSDRLGGFHAARGGDRRIIYSIDEAAHTVEIVYVTHRRYAHRRS